MCEALEAKFKFFLFMYTWYEDFNFLLRFIKNLNSFFVLFFCCPIPANFMLLCFMATIFIFYFLIQVF